MRPSERDQMESMLGIERVSGKSERDFVVVKRDDRSLESEVF